jgi:type I restriction enzyme, R subunit
LGFRSCSNNSSEQALLGDFASAVDNAVMESADAHQNQMNQVLSNKHVAAGFGRIVFDLLVAHMKGQELGQGPPRSQRRG